MYYLQSNFTRLKIHIFVRILSDVVHQFFSIFGHYCPWPHFMIHLRPNGCPRDSADIDCSNGQDIAQIFCKYQTYMIWQASRFIRLFWKSSQQFCRNTQIFHFIIICAVLFIDLDIKKHEAIRFKDYRKSNAFNVQNMKNWTFFSWRTFYFLSE